MFLIPRGIIGTLVVRMVAVGLLLMLAWYTWPYIKAATQVTRPQPSAAATADVKSIVEGIETKLTAELEKLRSAGANVAQDVSAALQQPAAAAASRLPMRVTTKRMNGADGPLTPDLSVYSQK